MSLLKPYIGADIKVQFIVATRENEEGFWSKTATGRSLALYQSPHLEVNLYSENLKGLPEIYNMAIEKFKNEPSLMIFAHDDIHILDFYWIHSILNGLNHFGIVGVAGNKRRAAFQPSWAFIDQEFKWDDPDNLSGIVGHGSEFPPADLSVFGPPFQEVKLLDGVMLAAFSETLVANHMRFEEKFQFHFYDMDFCRQAEVRGITMGTTPLSLVHESGGSFGSRAWREGYEKYIDKWGN